MTRGEEIKCASKDYINYLLDKQEYHNENYTEYDIQQAFEKGAQWADDNLKNTWISVEDDLPCNHKELISGEDKRNTIHVFVLVRGLVVLSRMEKFEGEWHWITDDPTYWMIIPELPK